MIQFTCVDGSRKWDGEIRRYKEYGDHYHIYVASRGTGIDIYFGRASMGQWFVCCPEWDAGTIIGSLGNVHHSTEKLSKVMRHEDNALIVAHAIAAFGSAMNIEEIDSTQEYLKMFKEAGFEMVENEAIEEQSNKGSESGDS